MWHNSNPMPGSYPHPPQGPKQPSPVASADSWEDQYDSGALDARLQQMHVSPANRGHQGQGQGRQQPGSYPHPQYNQGPVQMFSQPPPNFANGPRHPPPPQQMGVANGSGLLPTPGQVRIAKKPQQSGQPPENRFSMPPPQILPRSSSAPHAPVFGFIESNSSQRLPPTMLFQHQQKQMQQQQQQVPQQPPPMAVAPRPQIMTRTLNESSCITEYKPPEPQLKILKRPSSSGALSAAAAKEAAEKSANQPKSLKQREEEYAQARLRILGSTGQEDEEDSGTVATSSGVGGQKGSPSVVVSKKPQDSVRAPKGPDGSKGFNKKQ